MGRGIDPECQRRVVAVGVCCVGRFPVGLSVIPGIVGGTEIGLGGVDADLQQRVDGHAMRIIELHFEGVDAGGKRRLLTDGA